MIRSKMRRLFISAGIALAMMASSAMAIPDLQIFVAGATYDNLTGSWITKSDGFDLYVVSAKQIHDNVQILMSLEGNSAPDNLNIDFNGTTIDSDDWSYGVDPLYHGQSDIDEVRGSITHQDGPPAYFTEINTGNYRFDHMVGETRPDNFGHYWNPSNDDGSAFAYGDFKSFHINTRGSNYRIKFDAFARDSENRIYCSTPDSYDAIACTPTPEPGTIALFASGLIGLGLGGIKRRFKK